MGQRKYLCEITYPPKEWRRVSRSRACDIQRNVFNAKFQIVQPQTKMNVKVSKALITVRPVFCSSLSVDWQMKARQENIAAV